MHDRNGRASTDLVKRWATTNITYKKWKYTEGDGNKGECKEADLKMYHLLKSPLLQWACSLTHLIVYRDTANDCVKQSIGLVTRRFIIIKENH